MAASPRASWSSALRLLMPGPEERFSPGDARDAMFLSTPLHARLPADTLAAEFGRAPGGSSPWPDRASPTSRCLLR